MITRQSPLSLDAGKIEPMNPQMQAMQTMPKKYVCENYMSQQAENNLKLLNDTCAWTPNKVYSELGRGFYAKTTGVCHDEYAESSLLLELHLLSASYRLSCPVAASGLTFSVSKVAV